MNYHLKNRRFVTKHYMGSDGKDFQTDFAQYLRSLIENRRWEAMNEGQLTLNGAKQVLEELIEELEL